jgi:hypothetical protein
MANKQPQSFETSRRAILSSLGATVGGLALVGGSAVTAQETGGDRQIVLRQGGQCVSVTPFSGDQTVEEFYDYRLREKFVSEENGGFPTDEKKKYSSFGTQSLQQDGASLVFLYDGPEGLSLVFVHGSLAGGPSNGGSVSFDIAGLPDDGEWAVRDDYYTRPNRRNIANSNYDNWDIETDPAVIDWTYDDGRTDGGAFRGLGEEFSVSIEPAFNKESALAERYYQGNIDSWQLVVPGGDEPGRTELDMSSEITIETGTCESGSGGDSGSIGADNEQGSSNNSGNGNGGGSSNNPGNGNGEGPPEDTGIGIFDDETETETEDDD